jgi:hypothetical protein
MAVSDYPHAATAEKKNSLALLGTETSIVQPVACSL